MNKLLLISLLVLVPRIGLAEKMPSGCYVSWDHPTTCWQGSDFNVTWYASNMLQDNIDYYGVACGSIVHSWGTSQQEIASCVSDYNLLVNDYNFLVDRHNYYLKLSKKRLTLINKLKRACGSRCRNIK